MSVLAGLKELQELNKKKSKENGTIVGYNDRKDYDHVICIRCGGSFDEGVPLCDNCIGELKDFGILAEYLNGFKGKKDDLMWVISRAINDRQLMIINDCKVKIEALDGKEGLRFVYHVPKPGRDTISAKPWLEYRYEQVTLRIKEIGLLEKALARVRKI